MQKTVGEKHQIRLAGIVRRPGLQQPSPEATVFISDRTQTVRAENLCIGQLQYPFHQAAQDNHDDQSPGPPAVKGY